MKGENEIMKITYHTEGDYLIPDLTVEDKKITLGKYGRARLNYIKNYKKGLYAELIMTGELSNHLKEIDDTANNRVENIIKAIAEQDNTPIHYDGSMDQLEWVGLMNNYKNCAEKIVYDELIYC